MVCMVNPHLPLKLPARGRHAGSVCLAVKFALGDLLEGDRVPTN